MRDHGLCNCIVCNRRCTAWLCDACSFVSDYNAARYSDAPAVTASAVSRSRERNAGDSIAYEHVSAIRSSTAEDINNGIDTDGQSSRIRVRALRRRHSDVVFTANERRSIRAIDVGAKIPRPVREARRRRWENFANVWPRIALAHLVSLVAPAPRRRLAIPEHVTEMIR